MTNIPRATTVIDGAGRAVGRVSSEAARALIGKHRATYEPSQDRGDFVVIKNAARLSWTGRKLEQKEYKRTSGFLGGLKTRRASEAFAKDPAVVVRHAVYTMLPPNRLRAARMNRLTVEA